MKFSKQWAQATRPLAAALPPATNVLRRSTGARSRRRIDHAATVLAATAALWGLCAGASVAEVPVRAAQ